jgi:hypothetical protein
MRRDKAQPATSETTEEDGGQVCRARPRFVDFLRPTACFGRKTEAVMKQTPASDVFSGGVLKMRTIFRSPFAFAQKHDIVPAFDSADFGGCIQTHRR